MVLSESGVADAVDTWSDITQVTDIASALKRTLVKSGD